MPFPDLDAATAFALGIVYSGGDLRKHRKTGNRVDLFPLPSDTDAKATLRLADTGAANDWFHCQLRPRDSGGGYNNIVNLLSINWSEIRAACDYAWFAWVSPTGRRVLIAERNELKQFRWVRNDAAGAGVTLGTVAGVKTVVWPQVGDDAGYGATTHELGEVAEHRRWIAEGTLPTEPANPEDCFDIPGDGNVILAWDHSEESGETINDTVGTHNITVGGTEAAGDILHQGQNRREPLDADSPPVPTGFEFINGARIVGASKKLQLSYAGNTPDANWPIAALTDGSVNLYRDEVRVVIRIWPTNDMLTTNLAEVTSNSRELVSAGVPEGGENNNLQLKIAYETAWGETRITGFNKLNGVVGSATPLVVVPGDGTGGTDSYVVLSRIGDGTGRVIGRARRENDDDWTEIWNQTGGVQGELEVLDDQCQSKTPAAVTDFVGSEETAILAYNQIGEVPPVIAASVLSIDRDYSRDSAPAAFTMVTNAFDELSDHDQGLAALGLAVSGVDRVGSMDLGLAGLTLPVLSQDRASSIDLASTVFVLPTQGLDRAFSRDRVPPPGGAVQVGGVDRAGSRDLGPVAFRMPILSIDRSYSTDQIIAAFPQLQGGFVLIDAITINGDPVAAGTPGELLLNTDNYVELVDVREGVTGAEITSATASVVLRDKNGVDVGGQSWPTPLALKSGTTNTYWFSVGKAAQLEVRRPYTAFLTFVALGGAQRYWEIPFRAVVGQS